MTGDYDWRPMTRAGCSAALGQGLWIDDARWMYWCIFYAHSADQIQTRTASATPSVPCHKQVVSNVRPQIFAPCCGAFPQRTARARSHLPHPHSGVRPIAMGLLSRRRNAHAAP